MIHYDFYQRNIKFYATKKRIGLEKEEERKITTTRRISSRTDGQ
jgi:hypothetical protein